MCNIIVSYQKRKEYISTCQLLVSFNISNQHALIGQLQKAVGIVLVLTHRGEFPENVHLLELPGLSAHLPRKQATSLPALCTFSQNCYTWTNGGVLIS